MFNDDNPRLCPTEFTDNNPPTAATMSKTAPTWTYLVPDDTYIWGYEVTIWAQDTEGETWSPLPNWNAVLLRTYILGDDSWAAGDVSAQGLACVAGTGVCTLTFASITSSRLVTPVPFPANTDISNLKIEVAVVNLNGVESTTFESAAIAN